MSLVPRIIYVSASLDSNLNDNQKAVKDAIFQKLKDNDLEPWGFKKHGPLRKGWGFKEANEAMQKCQGAIVLAFAQWSCRGLGPRKRQNGFTPSEGNHFEGGLAMAHEVPLLVIKEEGTLDRGVLTKSAGHTVVEMPRDSSADWVNTNQDFINDFDTWVKDVKENPRVFLGYCSAAKAVAGKIIRHLRRKYKLPVCDYAKDFRPGLTILDGISKAAQECSYGVFLFTKDDKLSTSGGMLASPRDNVIFEAGYFMHAKGKERVLIVKEKGVKMPADIGGNIYINLNSRNDIPAIYDQIEQFFTQQQETVK